MSDNDSALHNGSLYAPAKTQLGSHPSVAGAMSNTAIAFRKAGKLK